MNTNPTVSRLVERAKITEQPNTRAKVDAEGDSYEFSCISPGHYACTHGKNTYIIIDKDGKIGCSCDDMTYRCTNTSVCKHGTKFIDLEVPPQIQAPGELIKKLMLMGWVGGKDDLHPPELLKPAQNGSEDKADPSAEDMIHYECPKCGEVVDIEPNFLSDWKLDHLDDCPGKKNGKQSPPPDPVHEPEDPEYPDQVMPELPAPPSEDYSNCKNVPPLGAEIHPDEGSWKPDEGYEPLPQMTSIVLPSQGTVPAKLATALCNMQKIDLLAVTDSDNPFHNAKYADLASVWAAIRKPLTDNGLAVIQTTEQYPKGITVVTMLAHTSGETFTSRLSCEVPATKQDKNGQTKPNIQGLGSTITYLRRYSLAAMVGVAPIDDDGEAAISR